MWSGYDNAQIILAMKTSVKVENVVMTQQFFE